MRKRLEESVFVESRSPKAETYAELIYLHGDSPSQNLKRRMHKRISGPETAMRWALNVLLNSANQHKDGWMFDFGILRLRDHDGRETCWTLVAQSLYLIERAIASNDPWSAWTILPLTGRLHPYIPARAP